MIEMKSSVAYKTWQGSIKPKLRTSYLTSLAIADFLGIHIQETIAYTTFENEKFDSNLTSANLSTRRQPLGVRARDAYQDEWCKDQVFLNLGEELKILHKKIKMSKNDKTGVLEGTLVI